MGFSSHKYAWSEIDWIPISCLDKMVAVKLSLFYQVYQVRLFLNSSHPSNKQECLDLLLKNPHFQVLPTFKCFKALTTTYNQISTPTKFQTSSLLKLQQSDSKFLLFISCQICSHFFFNKMNGIIYCESNLSNSQYNSF